MKRRHAWIWAVVLILSLSLAGCGSKESRSSGSSSSTTTATSSDSDNPEDPSITFSGIGSKTTERFVCDYWEYDELTIRLTSGNNLAVYLVWVDYNIPWYGFLFNTGDEEHTYWVYYEQGVYEFQVESDGRWEIEVYGDLRLGDSVNAGGTDGTLVDASDRIKRIRLNATPGSS